MAGQALVVDANIFVSALLKDSTTRKLLLKAREPKLFAPEFIREELLKYMPDFSKRLKASENELMRVLEQLLTASEIKILSKEEYSGFMGKALALSPGVKDVPCLALALKLGCPLWSQDSKLKKQSKIEVLSTKELLEKML